jgi:FkbM family methyltransferase
MSFSIKFGNFLYKNAFFLYRPIYFAFKKKQDKFEIDLLKKLITPGAQVIDIGANIGFYAGMIADLCGEKGSVHCFEPDAVNFKYLQKSCGTRHNIVLNNKAVSARTETLKFYTSPALNVDHRTYEPEVYDQVTEVKAVALDDYLKNYDVPVQLIKMDIQGFEMEALKGMEQSLNKHPNLVLISEFWPYGLKKAGSSASKYFQALQQKGMIIWLMEDQQLKLLEPSRVEAMEQLGEAHYFNILASRKHVH